MNASHGNALVWQKLYSQGKNDLHYPSEMLVRLAARLLRPGGDRRILDYGFGTGANLVHFAAQGYETHGVEISKHALDRTRDRLQAAALTGELRLLGVNQPLPYEGGFFDVVYAWQELCYQSVADWKATMGELERVTRKGGLVIIASTAPGDISQVQADALGGSTYRSRVPTQEGCIVTIPDDSALKELFIGRRIEVGEFGFRMGEMASRHWIVTYRTPET